MPPLWQRAVDTLLLITLGLSCRCQRDARGGARGLNLYLFLNRTRPFLSLIRALPEAVLLHDIRPWAQVATTKLRALEGAQAAAQEQERGRKATVAGCLAAVWKDEGPAGWFRGFEAKIVQSVGFFLRLHLFDVLGGGAVASFRARGCCNGPTAMRRGVAVGSVFETKFWYSLSHSPYIWMAS